MTNFFRTTMWTNL